MDSRGVVDTSAHPDLHFPRLCVKGQWHFVATCRIVSAGLCDVILIPNKSKPAQAEGPVSRSEQLLRMSTQTLAALQSNIQPRDMQMIKKRQDQRFD